MSEIIRTKIGILTYLAPTGSISDEGGLADFKDTVEQCIADREINLAVDLIKVPSFTSAALETMLDIQERLAKIGGNLKVINANPLVREIFLITGFDDYVAVIEKHS